MPKVGRTPPTPFVRRKPPHRITIARGGDVRVFTLRPWLAGSLVAFAAVFATLYLGATFYLVFRDDLLAASIARQARIQHAYEDRVASLRADIDRLTSRQLLNQQAFDVKMARLIDRQAALDARQDIIAGLSQAARRAGLAPDAAGLSVPAGPDAKSAGVARDPLITGSLAPAYVSKALPVLAAFLRPTHGADVPVAGPAAKIDAVEMSIDALAGEQVAYVEALADRAARKRERIAAVLARIGHPVAGGQAGEESVGGPFVPLAVNADPETFRSGVALVAAEIDDLAAVRRKANRLPLTRPIASAAVTSPFGARLDPFFGRPAMHTGVDFRAAAGYPIRSTAAGTVVTAGYTGGYGNLVEVDHGNGLTTRYAHMSSVSVAPGEVIAKGAIVGHAGSTGRSTGPHVHYEVRVDGEAIDPMRYIRAGGEIAPLL